MSPLVSIDPATGGRMWEGEMSDVAAGAAALDAACGAFARWSVTPLEERIVHVAAYAATLAAEAEPLARMIEQETGKSLWEGRQEVASMMAKIDASIAAQAERAGEHARAMEFGRAVLRHRPHGVMEMLAPYNFPGHLPNGHIVPALLAGDTVVFKPSEETPATGAAMAALWWRSGMPDGVLNLVQGGRETGAALIASEIDELLFTASAAAGAIFRRLFVDRPEVSWRWSSVATIR